VSAKAAGTKAAFSQPDQKHRYRLSERARDREREREREPERERPGARERERGEKKNRVETQTTAGPESAVQDDFTASHRYIASDNVKSSLCNLGKKMYLQ
jgi:hypothetical protein